MNEFYSRSLVAERFVNDEYFHAKDFFDACRWYKSRRKVFDLWFNSIHER